MKLLIRILLISFFWSVFITIGLEVSLRLAAQQLPERFQAAVQFVSTGERLHVRRIPEFSWMTGQYGMVIAPNLVNQTLHMSPDITVTVSTQSLWDTPIGFRTPPVDYYVDMVTIGDSHTFCFTEYADCWVSRLREQTGLGIVNLGQPGTGSLGHLNVLKDFARPLEPRLVLWEFFGNDFNEDYGLLLARKEIEALEDFSIQDDLQENALLTWLRRHALTFAVLETLLFSEHYYVDEHEQAFVAPYTIRYRDGEMRIGRRYDQLVLDIHRPQNQIGIQASRQALAEAQELVAAWDGTFVVLVLPPPTHVYLPFAADYLNSEQIRIYEENYSLMLGFCTELELKCLDLLPVLQDHAMQGEHLFYSNDGHLNPAGNALLADYLLQWLGQENLLWQS